MKEELTRITIKMNKGIHFEKDSETFLSVQIGPNNYCDNYNLGMDFFKMKVEESSITSTNMEVAVLYKGKLVLNPFPNIEETTDTVLGYLPISLLPSLLEDFLQRNWEEHIKLHGSF